MKKPAGVSPAGFDNNPQMLKSTSPAIPATVARTMPGIIASMAMIVAAAIIARSAAVGLGAPSVDVAAVPVAADDHADLVDGTAAGTAAMRDAPGRGGGMPPSGFRRGGSEDGKTRNESEQGNKFIHVWGKFQVGQSGEPRHFFGRKTHWGYSSKTTFYGRSSSK